MAKKKNNKNKTKQKKKKKKKKQQQKNNNFYPVFMKELQNAWNWSTEMDLRRTDIKQQNKNVN